MPFYFYLAIATVAVLFVAGVIAVTVLLLAAGTLYGENRSKGAWIVDARRRERRTGRELALWQNKVLERSGAGTLRPRPAPERTEIPTRRFNAPSTVINDMKKEASSGLKQVPRKEPVPHAIAEEFLQEAASAA